MDKPPPSNNKRHGGTARLTNRDPRHCPALTTRTVEQRDDPNTPQQSNSIRQTSAQHHWTPPGLTNRGPKGVVPQAAKSRTASNLQSTSGAARSTNRAPPAGRVKGFTHPGAQSGKPSEGKAADTPPRQQQHRGRTKVWHSRKGENADRPQVKRARRHPSGEAMHKPTTTAAAHATATATGHATRTRTASPRRPAAEKRGNTPPCTAIGKP
ncbi:hypothetical protein WOLCODRAFT_154743 [Wolfiporia cocos MD-104 SS10]|uniref:Uncharacterized protein n=1 Tax=Wolfiporia cocos (strain MD-104) TaxID=742152 RepID=A0A2H3JT26_WOLCO|nr:hypothetical protein WOLCODRAFT_154743 [Wolfiporia cocos MD-104 SS10]